MTDIKFIGTNQVELVNSLSENKISPTSSGGNFIEFVINTPLSKNDLDYYHFLISGENVSVSGQITEVTKKQEFCNLFRDCSAITDASNLILSAPSMKESCYANMFMDCTNLTTPPQIEAETLDLWCFQNMFAGCEKLSAAPILSATELAPYCYYCMFYGCKNLSSAPYLPATQLVDWCYNSMFYDCTSLTSISADFVIWGENATTNWVTGIETEGVYYGRCIVKYGVNYIPEGWTDYYSTIPITFAKMDTGIGYVALTGETPSSVKKKDYKYKVGDQEWQEYTLNQWIPITDPVSFSGETFNFAEDAGDGHIFALSGNVGIKVYGNYMSLYDYVYSNVTRQSFAASKFSGCSLLVDASKFRLPFDLSGTDFVYMWMFSNCTSLTATPPLPAEVLTNACYASMFYNCTSLRTPPELPATQLCGFCYANMFEGCTSLSAAPKLPATDLIGCGYCYSSMFGNCTSLRTPPELKSNTLDIWCYSNMFAGCTSLSTAPSLPATTLATACYNSMFKGCTSLTDAPELPASTLVSKCYQEMFANCTSLTSINVNFTDWKETSLSATRGWIDYVAPTGIFTKPLVLAEIYDHSHIPGGWTIINK